jgi:hypothetical protein
VRLRDGTLLQVAATVDPGGERMRFALVATVAVPKQNTKDPAALPPGSGRRALLSPQKGGPPQQPMLPLFTLLTQPGKRGTAPGAGMGARNVAGTAVVAANLAKPPQDRPWSSPVAEAQADDGYDAPFLLGPIAR